MAGKMKKKIIFWVIGVILIIIVVGFGLLGGSYNQLFKNLSGKQAKEYTNFLGFGGAGSSYGFGAEFTRLDCIKTFNAKSILPSAVCNSGGGLTSIKHPQGICAVRLLSPQESGIINKDGQSEAGWAASWCCGKTFLPEECKKPLKGSMYIG